MKHLFTLLFVCTISLAGFSQVRISQVYGAGGNSGAAFNQDYVEIYNAGSSTVSLDGWSIQYASATGPAGAGDWAVDSFPAGLSIAAGKYFLVALATGATGAALPTPDHTYTGINLATSAGKVALVTSQTPLNSTTACTGAGIADVLGYGSTATCFETAAANTSGLTNTEALYRLDNGCVDFNDNSIDFIQQTANPRNSATAANTCSTNELILVTDVSGLLTSTGLASAAGAMQVNATNLAGAPGSLTVTSASSDVEVSLNSGSGFANSVNLPYSAATLSAPVYVRLSATAALGAVSGSVIVLGAGAGDTSTISGNVLVAEPTIQASNIVTSNITDTSITVNWVNGNGGNRILVMHAASGSTVAPADSRSYTASVDYRNAASLGSGNYVLFNGTGTGPVNVIGLTPGVTYNIIVYEYDSAGTGTHNYLTSTAANNPVTVTTIGISSNLTQINFNAVMAPTYTGSGTATRTPTLYYATLSNLAPNTTYRYFTQAASAADIGTTASGAGNPILFDYTVSPITYTYTSSASLSNAGGYGKFTTDGNGSFRGTFGFVNTGNARFTAGNTIFPSITLAAEPATVAQYRFALNQTISVLAFNSSAGANNGSFFQGNSLATAGNIVALWDNETAMGRPLCITLAENPSFAGSTAWPTSFITGYSTAAGSWNSIIPNNNANGVRLLQQFDIISGEVVGCNSDADGVWPTGNVNTVNPTNGTAALQLSVTDAPLNTGSCFNVVPVKFEYLTAHKLNSGNALNWKMGCLSASIFIQIERSGDTRNFKAISSLSATQARCAEPFNFIDAAPAPGKNFYRLKITDLDGRVSYSPVVLVSNKGKAFELIGVYPSVVSNETALSIRSDKNTMMEWRITDMGGRVVAQRKQAIAAGSSIVFIDCARLATGMYSLTGTSAEGISQTVRFVKR